MDNNKFVKAWNSLNLFKPSIDAAKSMDKTLVLVILFIICVIISSVFMNGLIKFVRTIRHKDKNFGKILYVILNILILAIILLVDYVVIQNIIEILIYA